MIFKLKIKVKFRLTVPYNIYFKQIAVCVCLRACVRVCVRVFVRFVSSFTFIKNCFNVISRLKAHTNGRFCCYNLGLSGSTTLSNSFTFTIFRHIIVSAVERYNLRSAVINIPINVTGIPVATLHGNRPPWTLW